jgi:hypothetical protein
MKQNQQRPDLTPQEIVAAHPNPAGIKLATAWSAQQKANINTHTATLTNHLNNQKAIDREVQGITDNPTKNAALATAVKNGWITSDQAAPYLSMDVADPQWKAFTARVQAQTLDATQRAEAAKKLIDLRIAQATEVPVTQKAIAEATKAQQEAAGTQPITLQQKAQAEATASQNAVQNEINRARLGIARQELGLKQRGDTDDDALASTVIANPSLYDNPNSVSRWARRRWLRSRKAARRSPRSTTCARRSRTTSSTSGRLADSRRSTRTRKRARRKRKLIWSDSG